MSCGHNFLVFGPPLSPHKNGNAQKPRESLRSCLPPSNLPSRKRFHPLKSAQNALLEVPPACVLPPATNTCPTLGSPSILSQRLVWEMQRPQTTGLGKILMKVLVLGWDRPPLPQILPLSQRGEVISSRCSNHVCFAYLSSPAGLLTLGHSQEHNVLYYLLFTW